MSKTRTANLTLFAHFHDQNLKHEDKVQVYIKTIDDQRNRDILRSQKSGCRVLVTNFWVRQIW